MAKWRNIIKRNFFHAGVWSIAIPLTPLVVIGLLALRIVRSSGGGEAGLAALIAVGVLTFYAVCITLATTILGAALAIRALYLKKRITGIAGLIINVVLFCTSAGLLGHFFYTRYNDPDHLNIAVHHGDITTVEKLLDRGFNINNKYTQGETPLHMAMGKPEIAKLLISRGADVNAIDGDGRTPLFCLAALGTLGTTRIESKEAMFELADLLIQRGADIEARSTSHFRTPAKGCTPLHAAADAKGLLMIEKLLMEGANINALNDEGRTPLALAARKGYIEAARLLVEKGADINLSGNGVGYGPLMVAIMNGKTRMVEYLLKAGADPYVQDSLGAGTIHYAVASTQDPYSGREVGTDILRMLKRAGVDMNRPNRVGETPLYYALRRCKEGTSQKAIVQMLLENGASLDIKNPRGKRKTCLDLVRQWKVHTEEQKRHQDEIISLLERYK